MICSQNTAKKSFQFTTFPANMFLFSVRKSICNELFPDAQELLPWSNLKANICIFLYICLRKICFKDVVRFYPRGYGGGWVKLNNFLQAARGMGLVKCFTIFNFNWNFSKLNYFSVFRYISSIETQQSSSNLDFKGTIIATFLIRSHFLCQFFQ